MEIEACQQSWISWIPPCPAVHGSLLAGQKARGWLPRALEMGSRSLRRQGLHGAHPGDQRADVSAGSEG